MNATLGIGRSHVTPLISRFVRRVPQVEVPSQLSVTPPGVWRLTSGPGRHATTEAVKTRGQPTTNGGEIAVDWALDGHGILMRAESDIERDVKNGRLVQVLLQFHTPDADIHAVYPQRHQLAARRRPSSTSGRCRCNSVRRARRRHRG